MGTLSRFDDVLHYAYPTAGEVKELYRAKLTLFDPKFRPSNLLVERSVSLSQAEISRICDDAIKQSILTKLPVGEDMLLKAVSERLDVYDREAYGN